MNKRHGDHSEPTDADPEPSEEREWIDKFPSETVRAVEPNEVTAGVDVTLYDLDEVDFPLMVELQQHFPPEDDREGESVYFHGEHAALQVIAALSELLSERFEEVPWDDG